MLTITDKEFKQLVEFIKKNYGINLREEKRNLLISRLHNELLQHGFTNFSEYYEYINSDRTGGAVTTLINKITTNHTFFMREEDHFHYFKQEVLPYFYNTIKDRDLRIWSAGCSSGEEPYTLVMIIDEFFGKEKSLWDTKILATDISTKVLEKAKKGVYSQENVEALPTAWKFNYFNKMNDKNFVVADGIKNEVIYRKFNLMDTSFPFKRKFHVIFCRNVMIYFDAETKKKLINKYYDSLEYGGYLFIGHSESISQEELKYAYVMPSVYRKM